MTADLLLPVAACPGILDGWCGPVVVETQGTGWREAAVVGDYIVLFSGRGQAYVEVAGAAADPHICLDLSRAECRDRVARWLAPDAGAPPGWTLYNGVGGTWFGGWASPADAGAWAKRVPIVPALARLDPNDDTRLPDGSRRVDALALRAVAVEAGRG